MVGILGACNTTIVTEAYFTDLEVHVRALLYRKSSYISLLCPCLWRDTDAAFCFGACASLLLP